jgi:hypothetical protein
MYTTGTLSEQMRNSEDITNRLKEALQTLDRLDEAVDAYTVEEFEESESDTEDQGADEVGAWVSGELDASPLRTSIGETSAGFDRSALTCDAGKIHHVCTELNKCRLHLAKSIGLSVYMRST